MSFTKTGFIRGAILSLLICAVVYGGLRAFGYVGGDGGRDTSAELVRAATAALEAVKQRKMTDRRPASYDAVMAPLDQLLRQAKDLLASESYNPINDYEKVRAIALPVIDISRDAEAQAKTETGLLAKDFRFNYQFGEASQYLATAMWQRMTARAPRPTRPLEESVRLPQAEVDELRRVLEAGLQAAPENRDLWYIRGMLNRAEGLYAPAVRDLEKAISIDSGYAAAWNTLGLTLINLREFDKAEEALEKAKTLAREAAKRDNADLGPEYASILYNLATFHEGLTVFYTRENRVTPSPEAQRLLTRHAAEARKYFEEFLKLEPADSPDAKAALSRMSALPK